MQQCPYFTSTDVPHLTDDKRTAAKPKNRRVTAWVLSFVLHAITIALIVQFGVLPSKHVKPVSPLKSYLFVPLKASIEINKNDLISAQQLEKVSKLEAVPSPKVEQPSQISTQQIDIPPPAIPDVKSNEAVVLTNQNNKTISRTFDKAEMQTSKHVKQALLQQINKAATQALADQASKDHEKTKLSPNINTLTSKDTWELPEVAPKKLVDCSSAGKQVMAALSGLANGTLRCRDNSNFKKYIDKHLNKTDKKTVAYD